MMTMFAMTAALVGAMLGLRFKVLILVPAIIIGSAAAFGFGIAHSSSLWSILLAIAVTSTALQMGYLGGTVIRWHKKFVKPFPPAGARRQQPGPLSA
jgi:hypothetical protein